MATNPRLFWISSYPKSGNTWVRNFLYRYVWGEPKANIGGRSFKIDSITRLAGDEDKPVSDVLRDLHEQDVAPVWPNDVPERVLVKTHAEWTPVHPLDDEAAGAVLIVREPKDVFLSAINFFQMKDPDRKIDPAEYAEKFMAAQGDPTYVRRNYGTWLSQPLTWMERASEDHPVYVVGYRSLLNEPHENFTALVNHVFGSCDDDRLLAAIEGSSFENLRDRELQRRERRGQSAEHLFFNAGTAGRTISETLGIDIDDAFDAAFAGPKAELQKCIRESEFVTTSGTDL